MQGRKAPYEPACSPGAGCRCGCIIRALSDVHIALKCEHPPRNLAPTPIPAYRQELRLLGPADRLEVVLAGRGGSELFTLAAVQVSATESDVQVGWLSPAKLLYPM